MTEIVQSSIQAASDTTSQKHVPRLVVYQQTHHTPDGTPVTLLPLLSQATGVTHVIIAAIHLNHDHTLTLNDDSDTSPKHDQLWNEVAILQASGVPVLGMLGGAAKGSYEMLSGDEEKFNKTYILLSTFIKRHALSGLDLDIEEPVHLHEIKRLIDRLRKDFGPSFIITLAPVLPALLPPPIPFLPPTRPQPDAPVPWMSGLDYFALERDRGGDIAWYNTQLYCGWGDAGRSDGYEAITRAGWDPRKIVLGVITNPGHGGGYVDFERLGGTVKRLRQLCSTMSTEIRRKEGAEEQAEDMEGGKEMFGGVMGWEYFDSMPGGRQAPWQWAGVIGEMLREKIEYTDVQSSGQPAASGVGFNAMTETPHAFPEKDILTLKELGFSHQAAISALNMTEGNVEYAAGLLFDL